MKCPRCGNELTLDSHRKIPLYMCYSCGYIEGRSADTNFDYGEKTNFSHMRTLNFNEQAAFISKGLGIDEHAIRTWMLSPYEAED